ncbi:transposase [Clostridia bacterium]|nr:transposase [Clostridia bacterium]GHV07068.1 transposase [Clostridia bacterium]
MAYVTIPKDLTKVKTKVAFGLTKRQLICFGAAAVVGLPLFFLTHGFIPTSAAAFLMVLVMLPMFLFAMYEKQGQPLEKVLRNIISTKFTRPRKRLYQTDNLYSALERQAKLYREVQNIVRHKT